MSTAYQTRPEQTRINYGKSQMSQTPNLAQILGIAHFTETVSVILKQGLQQVMH